MYLIAYQVEPPPPQVVAPLRIDQDRHRAFQNEDESESEDDLDSEEDSYDSSYQIHARNPMHRWLRLKRVSLTLNLLILNPLYNRK